MAADQPSDWPRVDEIQAYNRRVRARLDELLDQAPEQIVHVALEHRLMHAETLAYLLHNLPYDQKSSGAHTSCASNRAASESNDPCRTRVPPRSDKSPANSAGTTSSIEHQVNVPGFRVSKYKITNGQYLDFVQAGASAPHFWQRRDNQWFYRGMFFEVPLP